MNGRVVGLVVVVLCGCSPKKDPPPAPPPPPPAVVDAGVAAAPVKVEPPPPLPEAPDVVAAFPDSAPASVSTDQGLLALLIENPAATEQALAQLDAPDSFRVSLIAGFARARGEKSFDVDAEPLLPSDAGVSDTVDAGAPAWIATDDAPFTSGGKVIRKLPLETKVQVVSLGATNAVVELRVAKTVIYGPGGHAAEKIIDAAERGSVPLNALRGEPLDVAKLIDEARTQRDDEAGQLAAIAMWQRAWRIERSARTREGLLRAGFAAKRASTVVLAALARDFAPAKGVTLEWACGTDAPPSQKRLTGVPAKLDAKACLAPFDARSACEKDSDAKKKKAEANAAFVATLPPHAWLHFTVDARSPRQVLVVSTPLLHVDSCDDFEQVFLETGSGKVRRLSLPLGNAGLEVWVPVERALGLEHAVISAASEQAAITWLRSRAPYKWVVDHHDLQVSLTVDSQGFKLAGDVTTAAWAVGPDRACGCDD
ncbi:MAG: hypothetical protein QM817_38175 [Archangium sp.]